MKFQKSLFSEQIEDVTQQQVHDCLIDVNPYLWASVVNPFDEFLAYRRDDAAFRILDEGESAQWLRIPQIIDRAKRIFSDNDAFVFRHCKQLKYFEYKDMICISFKKVKRRNRRSIGKETLERSNYLTPQNREYWNQSKMVEFSDLPRIIVGYELTRELTDIKVLVCYPRTTGRGFRWTYKMPNQDAQLKIISEERAKGSTVEDEFPSFIVKPRTQHGDKLGNG